MKPIFLAERVRKAREQRGLNQTALANATLFASSYISGIETGKVPPSQRALHLIAQALGKTTEYFFNPTIPEEAGDLPSTPLLMDEDISLTHSLESAPDVVTTSLEACRVLVQNGDYTKVFNQLEHLDTSSMSEIQMQAARFIRAIALDRTNQIQSARELLRVLLDEVKLEVPGSEVGLFPSKAQILFELGASYTIDQQLNTAIENYEAVLHLLGAVADEHPLGFNTYAQLGRIWRQRGNLEMAARYYEKARQHPQAHQDDRVLAQLRLGEGLQLVAEKRFAEARAKLAESERLYEKLRLIEQASSVASYLNVVRAELNEFDKLEDSPSFANPSGSSSATTEAIVMSNQAAVLRLKGDPESLRQANLQMERTLQFMTSKLDEIRPATVSQIYHEAALLAVKCDQQEEGLRFFEKALDVLRAGPPSYWSEFEKIYDDFEQALLNWHRDADLAQMSRQRLQDKKQFNLTYTGGGGSSSSGVTPLSSR